MIPYSLLKISLVLVILHPRPLSQYYSAFSFPHKGPDLFHFPFTAPVPTILFPSKELLPPWCILLSWFYTHI